MIINKNERYLVIEKNDLKKVLGPGNYTRWPGQILEKYMVENEFVPRGFTLDYCLAQDLFNDQLEVVSVKDNEIILHFVDGNFKDVLKTGKHGFWKSYLAHSFVTCDLSNPQIPDQISRMILMRPEIREFTASFAVESHQKGILLIDNQFVQLLEPGNYFYWKGAKSLSVNKVDLRQLQLDVAGQEILSRDKIPLRLNFFCQYKIADIQKAVIDIKDYEQQFHVVLQLALREYIGTLTLDEILEKKAEIGTFVTEKIKPQAQSFGLEILSSGLKDIILPGEIKEILNQVLIAEKKSQANVIMRREETASTRSLLNTAKLMEENEVLYKLKELEYVEKISERISQISLSGNGQIIEQLKDIFLPKK